MDLESRVVESPHSWAANHVRQYLESDGRVVDHPHAEQMVVVYVEGRSSGQLRRFPLLARRDGEDWLVVASKGGAPDHPQWYLNLVAKPGVWVRDGADTHAATAVTLGPEERASVWPVITELLPMMAEYEAKTDRVMPVVRLVRGG